MVARNPLVLVSGQVRELPAEDTVLGASGGVTAISGLTALPSATLSSPPGQVFLLDTKKYLSNYGAYWAEWGAPEATAYPGGAGDPFWGSVTLLLEMGGRNGSLVIYDDSPLAIPVPTSTNSARVSTAQSKFGPSSLSGLDGFLLGVDHAAAFNFGTGDFCIEAFFRLSDSTTYQFLLGGSANTSGQMMVAFNQPAGNIGVGTHNVAWQAAFAGFAIPVNTWFHIALTRSGTNLRCFINGVQIGSTATNSTSYSIGSPLIGQSFGSTSLAKFIDGVRVTKGAARYTGNFTPPDAVYPKH